MLAHQRAVCRANFVPYLQSYLYDKSESHQSIQFSLRSKLNAKCHLSKKISIFIGNFLYLNIKHVTGLKINHK